MPEYLAKPKNMKLDALKNAWNKIDCHRDPLDSYILTRINPINIIGTKDNKLKCANANKIEVTIWAFSRVVLLFRNR